jgi:hypothetical protein
MSFFTLFAAATAASAVLAAPSALMEERQIIGSCYPVAFDENIGDGNPTQLYKYKQMTVSLSQNTPYL